MGPTIAILKPNMMKKLANFLEGSGYKVDSYQKNEFPNKSQASSAFDFLDLIAQWPLIVGQQMANHSIPLKLINKNLTLLTDHPTYSQSLKLLETMLIEKIEKTFPVLKSKIHKIHFQVNSAFFKETVQSYKTHIPLRKEETQPKLHPQSPEYKKLVKDAESFLGTIEDQDLKKTLTSIFIQCKLQ